jgi:hypothetical protein
MATTARILICDPLRKVTPGSAAHQFLRRR